MNWPTREEWAKQRRTAYGDDMPSPSRALADYASGEEAERAVVELRELWRLLGWTMRQVKPADDRCRADVYQGLQERRHYINRMVADLRKGEVPGVLSSFKNEKLPTLHAIVQRHRVAYERTREAYREECASRPVDDAAWQKELEHRARIDKWWDSGGVH